MFSFLRVAVVMVLLHSKKTLTKTTGKLCTVTASQRRKMEKKGSHMVEAGSVVSKSEEPQFIKESTPRLWLVFKSKRCRKEGMLSFLS